MRFAAASLALLLSASAVLADRVAIPGVPTFGGGSQGVVYLKGLGGGGGGGGYTGPGDIVSGASHFWSNRAYSGAIAAAGTRALKNVVATGTTPANVACDVLVISNGGLGLTANCTTSSYNGQAWATFCATGSGTCATGILYDQVGVNNLTATGTTRPTASATCFGSLPGDSFVTANSQVLANASIASIPQPFTVTLVMNPSSGRIGWGANTNGNPVGVIYNGGNTLAIYDGLGETLQPAFTAGTIGSILTVWNGASSAYNVASANVAGQILDPTAPWGGNAVYLGADNYGFGTGCTGEMGFWPVTFNPTQMTNMVANMAGYW